MTNYARTVLDCAARNATLPAVVTDGHVMDFGTLAGRVRALASALATDGFGHGDGLAVCVQNRPEFVEALLAAWALGGYVAPINPRLHPSECAYQISDSRARFLVTSPSEPALGAVTGGDLHRTLLVGKEVPAGPGMMSYEDAVERHLGAAVAPEEGVDDEPMWLFYTSGTTGRPKGVVWTHRVFATASALHAADMYPAGPGDGILVAAPATHGAGIVAIFGLSRGATVVFTPTGVKPTPDVILETVEAHRPTTLFLTPTIVTMLRTASSFRGRDLSSLRSIIYGGSSMPAADLRAAVDAFPGVDFVQMYGQGECCTVISVLAAEDHRRAARDPALAGRLASAGVARSLTELAIVDDEGNRRPAGEIGEIVVRGPATAIGYWQSPDLTAQTFADGWVHTGDVGRIDEFGYVFIVDRKKDMVISGGMNISTREIEDALNSHHAVVESAVIGVPHPVFGESVCAVVVASSPVTPESLTVHVTARLAVFKKPQRYEFVDELPKNSTGKVQKAVLRAMYRLWVAHGPSVAYLGAWCDDIGVPSIHAGKTRVRPLPVLWAAEPATNRDRTTVTADNALDFSDAFSRRARSLHADRNRLSSRVAGLIARTILEEELEPGRALPPEREMIEYFRIGRATLREALRLLEADGLVRMRMGPHGGPEVSRPEIDRVTRMLLLFLVTSETTLRQIYAVRSGLDPITARHAAQAATPEQRRELLASVKRMQDTLKDEEAFLAENTEFHRLIALACGNPMLMAMSLSLHTIIDGHEAGAHYGYRARESVVGLHGAIVTAIDAGDGNAAAKAAAEHVRVALDYLERKHPAALDAKLHPTDLLGY